MQITIPLTLDIEELLAKEQAIAIIWTTQDVLEECPNLTRSQAWQVLQFAHKEWLTEGGFSFDNLTEAADSLFPELVSGECHE